MKWPTKRAALFTGGFAFTALSAFLIGVAFKAGKFSKKPPDPVYWQKDDYKVFGRLPEWEALGERIAGFAGLHAHIPVYYDHINNHLCAYAVPAERRVMIGPQCYSPIYSKERRLNWKAAGVLAHEIGHVLNGHWATTGVSIDHSQTEADEFAGWALYMLGASREEAIVAATAEWEKEPEPKMKAALEAGWRRADEQTQQRANP